MDCSQLRGTWNGTAWPVSTAELEAPTRLALWTVRRWMAGLRQNSGCHWSMVWNEFAGRMGAHEGRQAMTALVDVMSHLQRYARRRLQALQPCCAGLSGDEICLLRLLCACQYDDQFLARALAQWLVREEGVSSVTVAASDYTALLARHGMRLPRVEASAVPATARFADKPALAVG